MKKALILIITLITILGCVKKEKKEWTALAEGKTITLSGQISGNVIKMNVHEGDVIKMNDILAIIDTMTFYYQKQEVIAGMQELKAQSRLLDTQIDQAQKDYQYAEQKYNRTLSLVNSQSVPEQNLDDITNMKDKAQNLLNNVLRQKEVLTAKNNQLQAKISLLNKTIKEGIIRSSINGLVSEIYTKESELAKQGMPLIELLQTDQIEATFYVNETELPGFKPGDKLKVRLDGLNKEMEGTITFINSQSEFTPKQILTPDTRTSLVYGIKVSIANEEGFIKDGMPIVISR